ncbi:MAG TPA: tetratricopeptide repeat protein [Acidobacteriota bacterium]|nr:tetratricopeptide repeat protein [Acidobacteriota bacterium]
MTLKRRHPRAAFVLPVIAVVWAVLGLLASAQTLTGPDQARRYLEGHDPAGAETVLRRWLKDHPGDAQAWYLLGVAYAELGDPAQAATSFERCLELDPKVFAAYSALADAALAGGDRESARRVLHKGLEQFPGDDLLLFRLGRLYFQDGNAREALSYLTRVNSVRAPAGYWEIRGRAEMSLGDLAAAAVSFTRALEEKPRSVRLLQVVSALELKRGRVEEAWNAIAQARSLAPDSPKVVYAFAVVSLENGLVSESIATLRLLLLREPDHPDYLMMLGNAVLESATEYSKAPDYFARYVELQPDDPLGHMMYGYSLYTVRRYDEATVELNKTLELQPGFPEALFYLGMIAFNTNREDEAIDYFQRVLADSDQHMKAHLTLGKIWLRRGRFQEAVSELQRALELSGGGADIHYNLSRAYSQLGDREKAREHLEKYQEFKKLEEEREVRSREFRFLERFRPASE